MNASHLSWGHLRNHVRSAVVGARVGNPDMARDYDRRLGAVGNLLQRAVTLNSMRRLRDMFEGVSFGKIGRIAPNPIALSDSPGTPARTR